MVFIEWTLIVLLITKSHGKYGLKFVEIFAMFTPHCALNLLWLLTKVDSPQIVFILEYLAKVPRHTPYKHIQNRLAGITRNRRKCYWQQRRGHQGAQQKRSGRGRQPAAPSPATWRPHWRSCGGRVPVVPRSSKEMAAKAHRRSGLTAGGAFMPATADVDEEGVEGTCANIVFSSLGRWVHH